MTPNDVRAYLAAQGSTAVILPMPRRTNSVPFDVKAYKAPNTIKRAFNRLKDWRAIATSYDKKASNCLAGVCLAAVVTNWLHWVHTLALVIFVDEAA